jgi:hypothetical protein
LHAAGLLVIGVAGVASAPRASRPAPPVEDSEVSLSFDLVQDEPPARALPLEPESAVAVAGVPLTTAAIHRAVRPGAVGAPMGVEPAPPVVDGAAGGTGIAIASRTRDGARSLSAARGVAPAALG